MRSTSSPSSSWRSAYAENVVCTCANCSAGVSPAISEEAVIAPALIIGLRGRPVRGSTLISLNGSPEGSTSIFAATASAPQSSSASP